MSCGIVQWLFIDDTADGTNKGLPGQVDEEDRRLQHIEPSALFVEQALDRVLQDHPDVVLVDLALPMRPGEPKRRQHGAYCATEIRKRSSGSIQVLVISNDPPKPQRANERALVTGLNAAGILGYLEKSATSSEIAQALLHASEGSPTYRPGSEYAAWIDCLKPWPHPCLEGLKPLTPTEHETMVLLAEMGGTNKQIGPLMRHPIGEHGVAAHIKSVCDKLSIPGEGAGRRLGLALWAVEHCPEVRESLASRRM